MPTRRQAIIGLSSAAVGGAVVSAGAFTSSVSAGADMRVVVVSELRLEPVRPEEDRRYVRRNDADEIEIEILELNRRARSEFGGLVRIINEGDLAFDRLDFEFDELGDEPAADVLEIVSEEEVTEEDGVFTLLAGDGEFAPGEETVFGIATDLLPESGAELSDLPDGGADVELTITAVRDEE